MVFVGGGGNSDNVTARPLIFCVLHCVSTFICLWHLFIFFLMLAWIFGFRMKRLTRVPGVLLLVTPEYSAVISGAVALSLYELLFKSYKSSQYALTRP